MSLLYKTSRFNSHTGYIKYPKQNFTTPQNSTSNINLVSIKIAGQRWVVFKERGRNEDTWMKNRETLTAQKKFYGDEIHNIILRNIIMGDQIKLQSEHLLLHGARSRR